MKYARIALFLCTIGLCAWTAQAVSIATFSFPDVGWKVMGPATANLDVKEDGAGVGTDGQKWVAFEITKDFRQGPDPLTGIVPSIVMSFVQTASDADTATRIFVTDEAINDMTGFDWCGYKWFVTGAAASFNEQLTNVNGANGFNVDPFEDADWIGTQQLSAYTGTVPSGGLFEPGFGIGDLVIDVSPQLAAARPISFMFKQLPLVDTAPEPATVLLVLAGSAMLRRRRA